MIGVYTVRLELGHIRETVLLTYWKNDTEVFGIHSGTDIITGDNFKYFHNFYMMKQANRIHF